LAKIKALPGQKTIDGLKGKLDFYIHNGQPVVRMWPRSPGKERSPAVEAQWPSFSYAAQLWSQLSKPVQDAYNLMAISSGLSGRDLQVRSYLKGLYRYPVTVEEEMLRVKTYRDVGVQVIPDNAWTKLEFNAVEYNPLSEWDSAVDFQFTCKAIGWYRFHVNICMQGFPGYNDYRIALMKNGGWAAIHETVGPPFGYPAIALTASISLVLGDTVYAQVYQNTGGVVNLDWFAPRSYLTVTKLYTP